MRSEEGKTTFQEADRRYAELRREHESGSLGDEELDAELKQLMVQDPEGRWWAKSPTTGEWHYHDGAAWVKDTPPGYQPPQAAPADQPEDQQPESLDSQKQARMVAWVCLAILAILFVIILVYFGDVV
jgi:t-SNARE complex subunit (syntaxin)